MRRVIPLGDVINLKRSLAQACPTVTVHLHDVCGGQTLSLDGDAGACACAKGQTERFFATRGMHVAFDAAGTTFWGVWE